MATRTLLGPLTTTWTPPASCTLAWLGDADAGTAPGWLAQDCHPVTEYTNEDDTACWPPRTSGAYTPSSSPRVWANGWGFYSPGLICPSGYSTACSATASGTSDFSMQFPLTAGETAVGCCPSGFTCTYTGASQTCVATLTAGTIPIGTCNGLQPVQSTLGNLPDSYVEGTTSARLNAMILSAPLFQINFRQADMPAPSTTGASTTTTATEATTTTTTSQPAGATVTVMANSSSNSGLSTAAQVGIGVAVGVVGLAIVAAVFFLSRRRRREQKGADAAAPPMQHPYHGREPYQGQGLYQGQAPYQGQHTYQERGPISPDPPSTTTAWGQSSIVTSELDAYKAPSELPASGWPTELPDDGKVPTGHSFYSGSQVDTNKFKMPGHEVAL